LIPGKELVSNQPSPGTPGPEGLEKGNACVSRSISAGNFAFAKLNGRTCVHPLVAQMLSENCTEALSIQANVMISGSSAKLIKNGIAPLPALLKQSWHIKRGERVKGHAPFYAILGFN